MVAINIDKYFRLGRGAEGTEPVIFPIQNHEKKIVYFCHMSFKVLEREKIIENGKVINLCRLRFEMR